MSEYRHLREKYTILELIKTPELACEVTMQPIKAFDLDAAIIFADILPPLEGMGLHLDFVEGEGPILGGGEQGGEIGSHGSVPGDPSTTQEVEQRQ